MVPPVRKDSFSILVTTTGGAWRSRCMPSGWIKVAELL